MVGGIAEAIQLFKVPFADKIGPLIFCMWLQAFFYIFLYFRQLLVLNENKNKVPPDLAPHYPADLFEKARQYCLDKNQHDITTKLLKTFILTVLLYTGSFYQLWLFTEQSVAPKKDPRTTQIWRTVIFTLLLIFLFYLVYIPCSIHYHFEIEKNYGFNRQSPAFYTGFHFKRFLLTVGLICPLVALSSGESHSYTPTGKEQTRKAIPQESIPLSLDVVIGTLLVTFLMIELIIFIIDRVILRIFLIYTPVPPGPLRNRLDALANRLSFPVSKITVVDASKWSSHTNAAYFGFILNKRIFLFDTLLEARPDGLTMSNEEMESIVGHELGHWHRYHVLQNMFANAIYSTLYASLFYYILQGRVSEGESLVLVRLLPFMTGLVEGDDGGFFKNYMSRRLEYDADRFTVQDLNKGQDLHSALIKLSKQNLSYPLQDSLYYAWYMSHPTLIQRLEAVESLLAAQRRRND